MICPKWRRRYYLSSRNWKEAFVFLFVSLPAAYKRRNQPGCKNMAVPFLSIEQVPQGQCSLNSIYKSFAGSPMLGIFYLSLSIEYYKMILVINAGYRAEALCSVLLLPVRVVCSPSPGCRFADAQQRHAFVGSKAVAGERGHLVNTLSHGTSFCRRNNATLHGIVLVVNMELAHNGTGGTPYLGILSLGVLSLNPLNMGKTM